MFAAEFPDDYWIWLDAMWMMLMLVMLVMLVM